MPCGDQGGDGPAVEKCSNLPDNILLSHSGTFVIQEERRNRFLRLFADMLRA